MEVRGRFGNDLVFATLNRRAHGEGKAIASFSDNAPIAEVDSRGVCVVNLNEFVVLLGADLNTGYEMSDLIS